MITSALIFLIGLTLIVVGATMISIPWGLITGGIILAILGIIFAQSAYQEQTRNDDKEENR